MIKTNAGNYFEDFRIGQVMHHATPRTITTGDVSLYTALYGTRFAVQSSDAFARAIGYERSPVDDMLVFHVVFGKTVPDISLNAVANLGYAGCRFLKTVYPGTTLRAVSEVIGLKENSSGDSGVVYVRSAGIDPLKAPFFMPEFPSSQDRTETAQLRAGAPGQGAATIAARLIIRKQVARLHRVRTMTNFVGPISFR